jgi:phenylalanyl-tRNA synthetase beta chain
MRHSVLTGVLEVMAFNFREMTDDDIRMFEVGSMYLPRPGKPLPNEPRRLALALCGRRQGEFWAEPGAERPALDFFDLKGVVEGLVADLHLPRVSYQPSRAAALHPGRAADLLVGGREAGWFGELHPRVAEAFGLGRRAVLVGEIDLEVLRAALPPSRTLYRPVSRFPAALRDVAVIVDEGVPAGRVAQEVRAAGGELLRGLRLFDVYRGESIPPGTKSLAYALTYQADDRTLTDKEVEKAHKKVEDRLRQVLGAQIRGKETAGKEGSR